MNGDPRPKVFWRKKTPTIIQMEAVECGAVSLAIILAYYGRYVPLEVLRIDCGVSRDGSNALNIIRAARKYGLKATGYRYELSDIYQLKSPAILFWNFYHFLVVEGFGKKKVFLNDPANGPRTVDYEELDSSYTGVVIVLEPLSTFQKGGRPPILIKELSRRLKYAAAPLSFLFLTGLFLLLPGLILPAFTRIFVDNMLSAHVLDWPWQFLGGLSFAMVIAALLTFLRQYYLVRLNAKLSIRFSSEFFLHLLRLPLSFYTQRYFGEIAYRMTFNDSITTILTGQLATTLIDLLLIVFYGIVMIQYDLLIALIAISAAILNLVVMFFIQRSRKDAYARLQQDYGKSIGNSIGTLQNIETIKATGLESDAFAKFAGYYTKNINASQEIGKKDAILSTFPMLFQSLALAVLLIVGSLNVMEGKLTIGMLMGLQTLLLSFLSPVSRFVNFSEQIQNLKINVARLDDVLKNEVDPLYKNREKAISLKRAKKIKLDGYLEFRNVTFGYNPLAEPLLTDLSFLIKPGERLALVGPTGCGKSTIAKLACGLYRPWKGKILYDGESYDTVDSDLLHRSLTTVDQEIFLYAGTIRENITLWDQTVSQEMLFGATHDACIHEEILARSTQGYEALLTERGRNLSGGQKQRIEIARALVFSPSILIMDEATSALDSEIEKQISDHIRRRGCSCLMIAHRLSTIQDCSEIIVLDKGKIIERGTHDFLKKKGGLYSELIKKEEIVFQREIK